MNDDILLARKEIEAEVDGRTLVDALADTAAANPDVPAYSDKIGVDGPGWRTLTWSQVRETGLDGAAGLVALGVQPGDTVAIMATNRTEHLLADIAGVHAAAIPMSVYNTLSPEQVAFVAGHAEPTVAFLEGADQLERWGRAVEESTSLRAIVVLDGDAAPAGPSYLTWEAFLQQGKAFRAEHAEECEERIHQVTPDTPATILYTSGTTGDPKGVVLTHRNVLYGAGAGLRAAVDDGESIAVSYLPYAHIAERMLGLYIAQVIGAHVHLIQDPTLLVGALGEVHPTRFFGVPRVWEKIQTGIGGLLAMETDPAKKQATADAMAAGLAYVESLQTGHETTPEVQAAYDAADAAVLAPIRGLLGLDRVVWAGQRVGADAAGDRAVLRRARDAHLRHLRHDRDLRVRHRLRAGAVPARHRRPPAARHRGDARRRRRAPDPRPDQHRRLPQAARRHRPAARRRRLGAHR